MKSKRIYPAFTISKKGEMSLKNGHPWVYCDCLLYTSDAADE